MKQISYHFRFLTFRLFVVAMCTLLASTLNAQNRLVANGFWKNSGTRTTSSALTDNNNVVYHFKATADGNVTIKLSTIDGTDGSFISGMVYDKSDADAYLLLYSGTTFRVENDDDNVSSPAPAHIHNARIDYDVHKNNSYSIVATTRQANGTGTFNLEVTGPVSAPALSLVTPITFISATGSGNSIEKDRAVCMYANADLCLNNNPTIEWKRNGSVVAKTYPYPYYFNVTSNTTGNYTAKITMNGTSVETSPAVTLNMLAASTPRNTWKQEEFIITDWYDPHFTGTTTTDDANVQDWRKAGFTLLYGNGMGAKNFDPSYVLARVVTENNRDNSSPAVHCLINDAGIRSPKPYKDFSTIKTGISSSLNSYSSSTMTSNNRFAMTGYFLGDEPDFYSYSTTLSILELVGSSDPSKLVTTNLSWDENGGGYDVYTPIVRTMVRSPWAKVLTSTQYPFDANKGPKGYMQSTHFKRFQLYANEIKDADYAVNFWGLTSCCEEVYKTAHQPLPTQNMLRYNAFGPVTYGAKGIFWYIYNGNASVMFPHCPTNLGTVDHSIYDNLTIINNELRKMGPILMKLKWIGAFHGAATDPSSGETGLPTSVISPVYSITPSATANQTYWKKDSLCIGVHTDGVDNYLAVFNKSMYQQAPLSLVYSGYNNSSRLTISGIKYPLLFKKSTGKWEILPRTVYDASNNRIGFDLTTDFGDMQLIRLAPGNVIPLLDLSMDKIGSVSNINADPNADASQVVLYGTSNIGSTYDNIIFANQPKEGGVIADVRLLNSDYRGGIMIRQSLDPSAPMVYLCNYNSNSLAVYYRSNQAGSGVWLPSAFPASSFPVFLRLIRYGSSIRALISSNGNDYSEIANVAFPSGKVYAGLCVDGSSYARSTFSNVKINGYEPMIPITKLLLRD